MFSKSSSKDKAVIIAAIIAGVFSCIVALVGLGQPFVSRFVDVLLPTATPLTQEKVTQLTATVLPQATVQQAIQQPTSIPTALPTYTPTPTPVPPEVTLTSSSPTPVPPTKPISSPTTVSPTQTGATSGTKSIGEGYSTDELSLTLTGYSIGSDTIELSFVVKNESNGSILVRFQRSYFGLNDDVGNQYDLVASEPYSTKQKTFDAGATVELGHGVVNTFDNIGYFRGVISENASYLVVTVSQFMDLRDMQWRIDLAPQTTSEQSPAPDTMLSLNQGFLANGLSLALTDYSIGSDRIELSFVAKNESDRSMLVRFQRSYFGLHDDVGNQYDLVASEPYSTKQQMFDSGTTVELGHGVVNTFDNIGCFRGVISENTSYLVVTVSQFMDLRDMQWRIDLAPETTSGQSPAPGTTLSVNQGFSANGLSLTLTDYSIGSDRIELSFVVKNESNRSILVRFQRSYFGLHDDVRKQYDLVASKPYSTKQQMFDSGTTVELGHGVVNTFDNIGYFRGVISENASYLVVTVSQFMDLKDMQWRIDL